MLHLGPFNEFSYFLHKLFENVKDVALLQNKKDYQTSLRWSQIKVSFDVASVLGSLYHCLVTKWGADWGAREIFKIVIIHVSDMADLPLWQTVT